MNAYCESFNGTIQEEFVDYNVDLLFDNITLFNQKLERHLLFYNTKRVHCALALKYKFEAGRPLEFVLGKKEVVLRSNSLIVPSLKKLVKGITKSNRHKLIFPEDAPRGREVW